MSTENPDSFDITPTWAGILPYLLIGVQDGNAEGKRIARAELLRMAQAADKWNAFCVRRQENSPE